MASSANLYLIPPSLALAVWPIAEEFITAAADRGGELVEPWLERLADGRMQLWLAWSDDCEAAALTELFDRKIGKTCQIVACGGRDMRRWLGLLDEIGEWAKTQDCVAMRLCGRKGWQRMLPDYDVAQLILERSL